MPSFNDGVNVDTSGELRPLRLRDGWYVVGKGMMMPVSSRGEALEVIQEINGKPK